MKKIISIIPVLLLVISCGNGKTKEIKNDITDKDTTQSKTEVLDNARPSPLKRATASIGQTKTVVQWGSPSVKGREIWGMIVPYEEVWRSGANEATTVEFDKDVLVNGQELKAGKYGLFMIPRPGEWTIIFNSVWNQWGAFEYDEKKDMVRFNVKPETHAFTETLEYIIEPAGIAMLWENLKVKIAIKSK